MGRATDEVLTILNKQVNVRKQALHVVVPIPISLGASYENRK